MDFFSGTHQVPHEHSKSVSGTKGRKKPGKIPKILLSTEMRQLIANSEHQ
jgi:hypothetical protein